MSNSKLDSPDYHRYDGIKATEFVKVTWWKRIMFALSLSRFVEFIERLLE